MWTVNKFGFYEQIQSVETGNSYILLYSLFHKTLPKSSLQMHWISVRFHEIGDILMAKLFVSTNDKA